MKIVNRKAVHNYHILETLEAGVVLTGPEVKSIRGGRVDLSEGFIKIQNGQIYLKNVYMPPMQNILDYDQRRDRKLLLHFHQIEYLAGKVSASAVTLIPLSIYEKKNMFKVETPAFEQPHYL